MIHRIATILKDRIAAFTYVDKIGGLTRVARYQREGGEVVIPVAGDVDEALACDPSTVRDMVPDDRYGCIVYFEDRGTTRETSRTRGTFYSASLRLVCWVNTAKFGSDPVAADRILEQFTNDLNVGQPYNTDTLIGLKHLVSGIPQRGASIFSQYTYPEAARQYLLWPFDAFALDIIATYRIKPGCEEAPVPEDDACWTAPTTRKRMNPNQFTCDELLDPVTGLTPAQLGPDCLDCNGGGGPCDPFTVTVNDVIEFAEVADPCDASLNVPVVNEADEEVGTLVSGKIVVPTAKSLCALVTEGTSEEVAICVISSGKRPGVLAEIIPTVPEGDTVAQVYDVMTPDQQDLFDVTVQLQDSAANPIGAADVYPAGTTTTKTAPDGTVTVLDHLGETLGSTTVKSNGTAQVLITDWEGEFPAITENTPTYNNEGDNTTGWTTTNATVAVASGIFRASQTAAGTPGSAQVAVTQPVTGKDWVIYCRARSFGVGGAQLLRLKGTGTQEVIVYFNFNAVTGSQQAGTFSLRATNAAGVTSNMNVGTGLTFNTNWTDYALRYDSKNLAFGLFIRETNGWRLGAQVNGTSFAANIELLFNATAGNSWYEFEFLTFVAPNFQSIGDSLTRGSTLYSPIIASALTNGDSTWQRWANVYPSLRNNLVVNKGVGGDTTAAVDARIQVDVLNNLPKLVFLSATANDFGSITLAQRTANIQASINKCAVTSIPVILHSSSYATSEYTLFAQPAHRDYYREWWKDYRPTLTGVQGSIDVMGGLKDPYDYLDLSLSQSDNIHPTPTGYRRMGQWIAALPYA